MRKNIFDTIIEKIPFKISRLVELQNDITEQILEIIRSTKGLNQKTLAIKMGKTESYISRIVGGNVNVTLSTIVAFEEILGKNILVTPLSIEDNFNVSDFESEKSTTVDSSFNKRIGEDWGDFIQNINYLSGISSFDSTNPSDNEEISSSPNKAKKTTQSPQNYGNVVYA